MPAKADGSSSWLRVQWGIEFDWTGEARSKVVAMVGLPGSVRYPPAPLFFLFGARTNITNRFFFLAGRHHDERGELAKIPGIFEKLVNDEDPMTAVNSVVALIAGEKAS